MPLLQIQNLEKSYDQKLVLQKDKLEVPPGLHLLLGSNGSGKSTFIKVLAGLIPFEGRIILQGNIQLGKDHRKHRMAVNYAEADPAFPPYLNGHYLVDMYMGLKKSSEEQVRYLSALLGINDFLSQKISSYSSGMRKKLALLLAFMGSPELILLDEPFNALDAQSRQGLEDLIKLKVEEGVNFILATHIHTHRPQLPFTTEIQVMDHELHLSSAL